MKLLRFAEGGGGAGLDAVGGAGGGVLSPARPPEPDDVFALSFALDVDFDAEADLSSDAADGLPGADPVTSGAVDDLLAADAVASGAAGGLLAADAVAPVAAVSRSADPVAAVCFFVESSV